MPLVLAIIGGDPRRFAPYVALYHRAFEQKGTKPLPIAVHSPGYIADTDVQAREDFWLPYKGMRDRIGAERGWPPMSKAEFEQEIQHGSLYLGSPETVRRRSPRRCARSASRASISSTAQAHSRTTR
jgi:hypothetical protein